MPTFTFTDPNSPQKHRVTAPAGTTPEQAYQILQSQLGAAPAAESAPSSSPEPDYSPSAGMGAGEKMLVGAGAGLDRLYRGVRDLVKPDSVTTHGEMEQRQQERENAAMYEKYHPGGWATAGEIGANVLATAPVGGVLGAASKALPGVARAVSVGGRAPVLNTLGRAATEGATVAGLEAPGEDQSRLGNMAEAGVLSPLVPGLAKGADATTRGVYRTFFKNAAPGRAIGALDRTLGRETVDAAADAVKNPTPSMFPLTTAGTAMDRRMGALEAGSRARGTAPFAAHDENVARQSWEALQDATQAQGASAMKPKDAKAAILATTKVREQFAKNGVPITQRSFGQVADGTAVPEIREAVLRRTLGAQGAKMVPEEAEQVGQIADELARHEIHRVPLAAGSPNFAPDDSMNLATGLLGASKGWRALKAVFPFLRSADQETMKQVDQAMLDPQTFLKMYEYKRSLNRPLDEWESALAQHLTGAQSRAIGASIPGE